ncbi:hypothetical protein [Enemella evansiae]|uniref:hypothetical protein n=1 Tax=Enemella evansiae TaxID=2016499 RepID=UPI000B965F34|nr:hypothetical protein [Enemella evansiae]OYO02428.1 hypothetical protein CGZ97_13465 [Enemella evansiae]
MNDEPTAAPRAATGHVSIEELSDAAEQLLTAEDAARVTDHVQACAQCGELARALADACDALRSEPAPPMPDAVFDRLSAVVRAESERRSSGTARAEEEAERAARAKRTVGTFGDHPDFDRSWEPDRSRSESRN